MATRPRRYTFRIDAEGLKELERELAALGEAGKRVYDNFIQSAPQLANVTRRANEELGRAAQSLRSVRDETGPLAPLFRDLDSSLSGFAGRLGGVGTALSGLGRGGLAAAAALGAISVVTVSSLRAFQETEQRVLRLDAVFRATGQAAGVTTREIVDLASAIQQTTTATDDQILEAAGALATFRSVTGETFRDALRLGADMAEVFGGDVRSSVTQLGKALEDPATGLTMLRRVGVTFNETQRETIDLFVRTGDVAGAQRAILRGVEDQLGGAAAGAAGGLAGATKRVSDAWSDLLKRFADTTGLATQAKAALERLAGTLSVMERQITTTDPRVALSATQAAIAEIEARNAEPGGRFSGGRRATPANQAELETLRRRELQLLGEIELAETEIALARINGQEAQERAAEETRQQRRAALAEVVAGLAREAEAAKLVTAERERSAQIERAIAEARKADPNITEAQITEVRRLVEARLDNEDAIKRNEAALRKAASEAAQLDQQATRAAEAVVEKLLKGSLDEWEKWTAEVAEAEAAMQRLNLSAEKQERIRRSLAAASPAARIEREAVAEQARQAERAAEEYRRVFVRASDTATREAGNLLYDQLTGRARDAGEAIRNILLRSVADAAANWVIRPLLIQPVVTAIGGIAGSILGDAGVGGGGGLGAIGNLLGLGSSAYQAATGQSLLGGLTGISLNSISAGGLFSTAAPAITSAQAAGIVAGGQAPFTFTAAGAGGSTGLLGIGLGTTLGAAGLGFGAGTILGAFGANRTTSSIGGAALGAGAGFLLGGPVGALVGGLSGIVGGIFGGQKQGFSGGTSVLGIDPATGLLTVLGDTGKRYDAGSIANAVRPEVAQVNALLQSGGIRISTAGLGFNPLSSTQPFAGYGPGQGDGAQYGGSVESVLLTLLGQGRLSSENATINRVLRSGGVTSLETLQEGLTFAALFDQLRAGTDTTTQLEQAMKALREQLAAAEAEAKKYGFTQGEIAKATRQAFQEDIRRGILGIEDPLKLALEDFDRAAKERLAVARTLGADLVQVEKLTALERQRIVSQLGATATAQPGSLRGLVNDVVFGGLSAAPDSQRYFAALTAYNQAERSVLAAPSDAASRSVFDRAARDLLPLARDFLGTSQRFGDLQAQVLRTARRVDPAADPAMIAAQRIVEAQAQGTAVLADLLRQVVQRLGAVETDNRRLAATLEALMRRAA